MKVNRTGSEFSTNLHLGDLSYVIDLDVMGFDMKVEEIVDEAASFDVVQIMGDEPFKQKEDVRDIVNKLVKKNPNIVVRIHTDGNVTPLGLNKFSNFKNVQYIVFGKLKKSGINYDDRINEKSWGWFATAGAKFVFQLEESHELDEIITISTICSIKPSQIYLGLPPSSFKELCVEAKANNFNIYFQINKSMFEAS